MTSFADTGTSKVENEGAFTRFLRATEIDARLLGMIAALVVIWVGFHVYGQVVNNFGAFLTPRNLWNLSVQTASVGVMATGMVLVIVTPSYRPVCRLDPRVLRDVDGDYPGVDIA